MFVPEGRSLGNGFEGYFTNGGGEKHAGKDTKGNIGAGMQVLAGAEQVAQFGYYTNGGGEQHAGKHAKGNLGANLVVTAQADTGQGFEGYYSNGTGGKFIGLHSIGSLEQEEKALGCFGGKRAPRGRVSNPLSHRSNTLVQPPFGTSFETEATKWRTVTHSAFDSTTAPVKAGYVWKRPPAVTTKIVGSSRDNYVHMRPVSVTGKISTLPHTRAPPRSSAQKRAQNLQRFT